ncbi:MAG: CCA tRNA nucleotidyltransferase [Terriglobales bacterium]
MSEEALAYQIAATLRNAGFQAFEAGGSVRDRLLGLPASDYTIATDAHPETVMRMFPRHSAVGAQFGVVLVRDESGDEIEVATFRADVGYSDGRHPDAVRYTGDAREDVRRRDFTINGMLRDPVSGEVLDFVGGREDLSRRLVRAIGDPRQRVAEDWLRMLRAVRFAARLGFAIDAETMAAIRGQAAALRDVSAERVRDELLKMLTEGRARRVFELLDELGLLAEILPSVARMKGVEQPPEFHPEGDVWTHTLMMLEALAAGCAPELALGVLLHDVGKPPTFRRAADRIRFDNHAGIGAVMAAEVAQRLRLSRQQGEQVAALVANHMRFIDAQRMRPSTLKRFLRLPRFDEHLELHRLDCAMSHGDLSTYEFVRWQREATPPESIRPARLVDGEDLKALGYAPGPRFREILTAIEDAQLEGDIATRDEALALVAKRFPR